ncbi:MAG TPA: alpha/beta hydrolase [Steroidobacteraceae bacterium]|nr:alpha/beta hydrolase [Steroidobacteraceae bacterium]
MAYVHPRLRPLIEAAQGRPTLADISVEEARAQIAARTASRPLGPRVDGVLELEAEGPGTPIPIRVYRPERPCGLVVAFHGGGWLMGSRDSFDATCRNLAVESGLAVANVEYRLAPEHPFPAAIEDAFAATAWLASRGPSLGLPADKLVVLGESAGGNLAATVCLMARDRGGPAIRLQVLVYPAVDARQQTESLRTFESGYLQTTRDVAYAWRTYGVGQYVAADDWRVSPLLANSHAGLPPALIISAECDGTRDDSEAYAHALQDCGVPAMHVRYAGMLHTFFGMRGIVDEAAEAQRQVATAMRAVVTR